MILITGAAGRSGTFVVKELAARGVEARALVRSPESADKVKGLPGVTVIVGDMLRPETLREPLDGVDKALLISSAGPLLLETQATFIDAAIAAGVRHVIKWSGAESGVGFDPEQFRSTRSHEQAQRYLEGSGLEWTHLRPSQFMQVYLEELGPIVSTGTLSLPLDDVELAPVDLVDVAKIAAEVLTTDGHGSVAYDMTGPEALTMDQIAGHISAAGGRMVRYENVAPEEKRRSWAEAGFPPARTEAFLQLFAERRRHPRSRVDLSTHDRFGLRPTRFAEFAQRHAGDFAGDRSPPDT